MTTTNKIVKNALNYAAAKNANTEWEKVYQIKGLPVRFVWRGDPYNDLKPTINTSRRTSGGGDDP